MIRSDRWRNYIRHIHKQLLYFKFIKILILSSLLYLINLELGYAKDINIAILDSGICPQFLQLKKVNSQLIKNNLLIKVNPNYFATVKKYNLNCNINELEKSPRFHGHRVLQVFIDELLKTKNTKINIFTKTNEVEHAQQRLHINPIVMLDINGEQDIKTWQNAIDYIRLKKFDYVISSIGLAFRTEEDLINSKLTLPPDSVYFLAAGERFGTLTKAEIFPQFLVTNINHKNPNYHLVGLRFKNIDGNWQPTPFTFYSDFVTDWYDEEKQLQFKGSSFAAPIVLVHYLLKSKL